MWLMDGNRQQQGVRIVLEVCLLLWLSALTIQVALNSMRHQQQREDFRQIRQRLEALEAKP